MLWRIGKALIGCCSCSCSPFSKPGKCELLFHHRGGEGRGEKKGGKRGKKRRSGCGDTGQVLFIQLAASTACPQPRLKNKGAPATFHWKIRGDSSDVLRDGYLTLRIKHERQWSLLCYTLPGAEEMEQRGRRMRSRMMVTLPHSSDHLCWETHSQALSSLHSPLVLVRGVHIFSIFSLPLSQFSGFVLNCTDAAQSQALCLTPLATLLCRIERQKKYREKSPRKNISKQSLLYIFQTLVSSKPGLSLWIPCQ